MKTDGVNLIVDRKAGLGICSAAKRVALALREIGYPFEIVERIHEKKSLRFKQNIIHTNPPLTVQLFDRFTWLKDRLNIAYWNWETEVFPLQWSPAFEWLNGIIVPSEFTAVAVKKASPVSVSIVPYCVSTRKAIPIRDELGVKDSEILFYFTFDALSDMVRKNPLAVLQAFTLVRQTYSQARLLIKSVHLESSEINFGRYQTAPGIIWINGFKSEARMRSYMASCDVYVSLHGAEGWGLPIFDALAMGKSIIQTRFSGPLDYCNDDSSVLVDFTKSTFGVERGPYSAVDEIAGVDVKEAVTAMIRLINDAYLRMKMGKQAKITAERLAPKIIGERLISSLEFFRRESGLKPHPIMGRSGIQKALAHANGGWESKNNSLVNRVRRQVYKTLRMKFSTGNKALARSVEGLYGKFTRPFS